jgi:hypothetical protein
MNKRFLLLAAVLAFSLPVLHADIGENFAKGGIGLSGSISFFNNFYYFLDDTEERGYWSVEVAPELDFFVAYRTSVSLAPWFSYQSRKYDADNIERDLGFGASLGVSHVFVMDPAAQRGIVFNLGASIGLWFYPGIDDLDTGATVPDVSMTLVSLYFLPRLYFFVNDRLAPYVGISPRLNFVLSYKDDAGTKIDLTSQESLSGSITATIGIAYFIPSRNASLFGTQRAR